MAYSFAILQVGYKGIFKIYMNDNNLRLRQNTTSKNLIPRV
jgi:hypothetical protein